jgi:hypothetical protein
MNLDTAALALGMVVLAEATAGVLTTVAISEAAALGAVISAQLAAGSITTAVVVMGVLASSVVITIMAGVIIGAIVAPTLAAALQARAPSVGSGEQTDFSQGGAVGSIGVTFSLNELGEVTVRGITGRGSVDLDDAVNSALDSMGLPDVDVTVDAPDSGLGLSIDLSPVDSGFPDVGLFMVAEPAAAAPAASSLVLLLASLGLAGVTWRRACAG